MSNGARHGLGVLAGLASIPLIGFALMFGTERMSRVYRLGLLEGSDRWVGAGLLALAAVLIGLLAGSRLSPVAALIPGIVFTVLGVLWVAAPRWMLRQTDDKISSETLERGYQLLVSYGAFVLVGVLLLISALPLSRWRVAKPRTAGDPSQPPSAPYGPPPGPPRYGSAAQPPLTQPPPFAQPGQSSSPFGAQSPPPLPPEVLPQSQPDQPAQRRDEPEEEPGEWTRMYGGGKDFRDRR